MNAILFDTLRLSRTLRDKGQFTPEQAETLAEALGEAQRGDLATKSDLAPLATQAELAALKTDIEAKIDRVEATLDAKIERVEAALEAKIERVEAALEAKTGMIETKVDALVTKAELADVRADILKWIVGAIGFQTIVMVGALVSLVRIFVK